jgi:hypothetical protein
MGRKYFLIGGVVFTLLTGGCQNRMSGNFTSSSSSVSQNRAVVIQATAQDSVGVTKVEFYVNQQLTCTITSSPYNCSWQVPSGAGVSYQLQTKAYDAQGKVGSSQIVNVTSR